MEEGSQCSRCCFENFVILVVEWFFVIWHYSTNKGVYCVCIYCCYCYYYCYFI